jgi:hypothetical protein
MQWLVAHHPPKLLALQWTLLMKPQTLALKWDLLLTVPQLVTWRM